MSNAKPYDIPKRLVWNAWLAVKANRGTAGVDGQTIDDFEADLEKGLYKIWNRMSSGSYMPPMVKRVEIAKSDGKMRPLGIPTVADRIAQMVVKSVLEPHWDPHFHPSSFGYRPRKSAHDAVRQAKAESSKAKKAIVRSMRDWQVHKLATETIVGLSKRFNAQIRGWLNYYGAFYPSALSSLLYTLDLRLINWARSKYRKQSDHWRIRINEFLSCI